MYAYQKAETVKSNMIAYPKEGTVKNISACAKTGTVNNIDAPRQEKGIVKTNMESYPKTESVKNNITACPKAETVKNMTENPEAEIASMEGDRLLVQKVRSLFESNNHKPSVKLARVNKRFKICTNMNEVFRWSNATPIRSVDLTGYACCYCDDHYLDPGLLKSHTLDTHPNEDASSFTKKSDMTKFYVKVDITGLLCKICSINVDNLEKLIHHLHGDHDKKLFLDAKNYMMAFKFDSDVLRCYICQHKFSGFKTLLEHMNAHYRNFICQVCDAGFITGQKLTRHSKSHKVGAFGCDYCAKVFGSLEKKKSHEKCVHRGANVNKCGYCNENFKYYHERMKHLQKVHGVAPATVKCHACDRTFPNHKTYRVHTQRDHLMERKFSCKQCEMAFYTSHELKNHMLKHTGERNFQCNVCLKSYGRKTTLREHLRIHADDRRYKCERCSVAFVAKCSWRAHMRTKHGETV